MAVVMKLIDNPGSGEVSTERMSGGYQDVASLLTLKFDDAITRQRVWMWWSRRARNGFPEGWDRPTAKGGVRRFYLDEVVEWYKAAYGEGEGEGTGGGDERGELQIDLPVPRDHRG